jgi:ribosomal protein L37E
MGVDDDWDRFQGEARELLAQRFPELKCVRCGGDNFLMRTFPDESLTPGLADGHVTELICTNCGFQERHVLEGLRGRLHVFEAGGQRDG